jgi:hypothetical protein
MSKDRIIGLQRQLKLATVALEKIAAGRSYNPEYTAEATLEEIWKVGPKQPLQGLVGHARRTPQ